MREITQADDDQISAGRHTGRPLRDIAGNKYSIPAKLLGAKFQQTGSVLIGLLNGSGVINR